MLAACINLRTQMSILLASVNGRMVSAIVHGNFQSFLVRIAMLFSFSIPSSAINAGLEYFKQLLACSFRTRLTKYFHDQYLKKMYYYKICNLDSRITNPDQRLTTDAEKWSSSLASLYLNISKPLLDMVMFSKKLSETMSWDGPLYVYAWYSICALTLRFVSPKFGKFTAIEQ